jgi:hypothetical protein
MSGVGGRGVIYARVRYSRDLRTQIGLARDKYRGIVGVRQAPDPHTTGRTGQIRPHGPAGPAAPLPAAPRARAPADASSREPAWRSRLDKAPGMSEPRGWLGPYPMAIG